jgi:hypothetical protein
MILLSKKSVMMLCSLRKLCRGYMTLRGHKNYYNVKLLRDPSFSPAASTSRSNGRRIVMPK